jgi:hypothetical protein
MKLCDGLILCNNNRRPEVGTKQILETSRIRKTPQTTDSAGHSEDVLNEFYKGTTSHGSRLRHPPRSKTHTHMHTHAHIQYSYTTKPFHSVGVHFIITESKRTNPKSKGPY